jgi:hypothetical protein
MPSLPINRGTLAIARKCLIPPKAIDDFDFLSTSVDWRGKPLKILVEHVKLANYNRQLVNWKLDDQIYRECVLTPTIQSERDGQFHWRRALWENFYPLVRKETESGAAAEIVRQKLRSQLTVLPKGPLTIEQIWQQKVADKEGFEAMCVAAWRSVGIAARLNGQANAEFFNGREWQSTSMLDF